MDAYTAETRDWLEERYRRTTPDGVYLAHQPIYGFRAGHCEPWLLERYIRTLESMRALSGLDFATLLDVGAAEGYKAALARHLFGCDVVASDLSAEACRRAEQIYGLTTRPGDVQALPFADDEFDVAFCSETLEHVSDFKQGVRELLRVSRVAVVITVPHEGRDEVEANKAAGVPHGHVQSLDERSLDWVRDEFDVDMQVQRLVHPAPVALSGLVEGRRRSTRQDQSPAIRRGVRLHNALVPLSSRLLGPRTEAALIHLDRLLCGRSGAYRAVQFLVVKERSALRPDPARRVTPLNVIGFEVPLVRQ